MVGRVAGSSTLTLAMDPSGFAVTSSKIGMFCASLIGKVQQRAICCLKESSSDRVSVSAMSLGSVSIGSSFSGSASGSFFSCCSARFLRISSAEALFSAGFASGLDSSFFGASVAGVTGVSFGLSGAPLTFSCTFPRASGLCLMVFETVFGAIFFFFAGLGGGAAVFSALRACCIGMCTENVCMSGGGEGVMFGIIPIKTNVIICKAQASPRYVVNDKGELTFVF